MGDDLILGNNDKFPHKMAILTIVENNYQLKGVGNYE
jgi:hypothetical protein